MSILFAEPFEDKIAQQLALLADFDAMYDLGKHELRSFAARDADGGRAVVAMAPGWIRTALGGDSAPFTMEEAIPMVADTLLAARATPGMHYLDRFGATVPW